LENDLTKMPQMPQLNSPELSRIVFSSPTFGELCINNNNNNQHAAMAALSCPTSRYRSRNTYASDSI